MKEGKVRGEERMRGSKQRGRKEERRERGRNNCYAVRMDQLMYHSCNLILLPSSSSVLILKSTPGEPEGEKRGTKTSLVPRPRTRGENPHNSVSNCDFIMCIYYVHIYIICHYYVVLYVLSAVISCAQCAYCTAVCFKALI